MATIREQGEVLPLFSRIRATVAKTPLVTRSGELSIPSVSAWPLPMPGVRWILCWNAVISPSIKRKIKAAIGSLLQRRLRLPQKAAVNRSSRECSAAHRRAFIQKLS